MRAKFGTSPSWRLAAVLCLALVLVMIGASTAYAVAPTTTINVGAGPTYFNGSVNLQLSAVDASGSLDASGNVVHGIAYTKYIDGIGGVLFGTEQDAVMTASDASHSVSASIPVSTPGYHYFTFYSADNQGNVEAAKTVQIVIVGPTPEAQASMQPSYAESATIAISGFGPLPINHVYYKLDGGAQTEGTSVSVNSLGTHTLEFWVTDTSGAASEHVTRSFDVLDTTAPTTTSNAVATYTGPAAITLTATDASPGVGVDKTYYRVDGTYENSDWTAGTSVNVTTNGNHTLEFYSVDKAGNTEAVNTKSFTIGGGGETIAPTTTSDGKATYPAGAPAVIKLTATDNPGGSGVAKIQYQIDNGTIVTVNAAAVRAQLYPNNKLGPWIPLYDKAKTLILPAHTGLPDSGSAAICQTCHNMIDPPTITQAQKDAGLVSVTAPGDLPHATQACLNCHTLGTPPVGDGTLSTNVSITGAGAHNLKFWAVDKANNEESHHSWDFTIQGNDLPVASTLGMSSTAYTVHRGKQFTMSGAVTPAGMVGKMVVVWVKKPGKGYYSYSSNRIVYAPSAGKAAWQYKYNSLKTMALGKYLFYCKWNGNAQFLDSKSKTITITLVR